MTTDGKRFKKKEEPVRYQWESDFPVSEIAEKAIIGFLLVNPLSFDKVAKNITKEDFRSPANQFIFELMAGCHSSGQSWTWSTLGDIVGNIKDRPTELEYPVSYIAELTNSRSSDADIEFNLSNLLNLKARRLLVSNLPRIEQISKDPSKSVNSIITELISIQNSLYELGSANLAEDLLPSNYVSSYMEEAEEIKKLPFIGTGFGILDKSLTWGFIPGTISLIAGRTSMGKSVFRKEIVRNLAKIGVASLTISTEHGTFGEMTRMLSSEYRIPFRKLANVKEWDPDFQNHIMGLLDQLSGKWPVRVVRPLGRFTLSDVRRSIEECRALSMNVKVVFIDLFAHLDDVNSSENSAQVISQKIIQAASIAKEMGVHICLVVQLRRLGNAKERDSLDFREYFKGSGGYEERADIAFMCHRPAYYDSSLEDSTMEITILKQKDGPTPEARLLFEPQYLSLSEDLEGSEFTEDTTDHLDL